jgi:hypothetical protein
VELRDSNHGPRVRTITIYRDHIVCPKGIRRSPVEVTKAGPSTRSQVPVPEVPDYHSRAVESAKATPVVERPERWNSQSILLRRGQLKSTGHAGVLIKSGDMVKGFIAPRGEPGRALSAGCLQLKKG